MRHRNHTLDGTFVHLPKRSCYSGITIKLLKAKQNPVIGATLEPVRLRDVYELIYSLSRTQKVNYLCTLFEVSRTAYYRYRRGESHNADKKYNRPRHEIRAEFIQNWKRYGSRRIQESLKQKGINIGRRKVSEIMRKEGLRAIQPRKFIPRTTDSGHGKRVSPNLLLGQPKPIKPNSIWVSDITARAAPIHAS